MTKQRSTMMLSKKSRTVTNVDYVKLENDIYNLKTKDISVGITINPDTDVDVVRPILNQVDSVLVMSVHPGFSGQSFIPTVVDKIIKIRQEFSGDIKVDGGVNNTNCKLITNAGANILISASYLFSADDYSAAIQSLR